MQKIIFYIFLFTLVLSGLNAQDYTLHKDGDNGAIYTDILPTKSGIWLFRKDLKIDSSKIIKVNDSNAIIAESKTFPAYYDEYEFRILPRFLGSDSLDNVYFYNVEFINEDSTALFVNKLDRNGNLVWKKSIVEQGYNVLLSKGIIKDNKLYCLGTVFQIEGVIFSYAFSLSLDSGNIIDKKVFSKHEIGVFFDATPKENSGIMALNVYLDENENVKTELLELDDNLNQTNLYPISCGNYFLGSKIKGLKNDEYLISGFTEVATVVLYNIDDKTIKWESKLRDAWDDADIDMVVRDSELYTMCSFLQESSTNVTAESVVYSLSLGDGHKIDSTFIDNDKETVTLIFGFDIYSNNIYFCGANLSGDASFLDGIWGTIDISNLTSVTLPIKNDRIVLYPNIAGKGEIISIDSKIVIDKVRIVDISGRVVSRMKLINQNYFKLPNLTSSVYFVILESKNSNYIEKIIIK